MDGGYQKDPATIRSLELPAQPLSSGKGKGTGDWVNDWSCLCDEASIEFPKEQGSESFWVAEHVEVLGEQPI